MSTDRARSGWRRLLAAGATDGGGVVGGVAVVWLTRAGYAAMLAALVLGAVGGVVALAGGGSAQPAEAQTADPEPPPNVSAAGFAETYVGTFLTTGGESAGLLDVYYPASVNLGGVAGGRLWARRTAAVDIEQAGEQLWSVTVAADVLTTGSEADQPTEDTDGFGGGTGEPEPAAGESAGVKALGIRYYQVAVAETDGHLVATSLPAQVPAPPTPEVPELAVGPWADAGGGDVDPAVVETVTGFLEALLAGSGDLQRYTAPSASIAPVTPTPFDAVAVRTVATTSGDGPGGELVVAVRAAGNPQGHTTQVLDYQLALARRDGRWEVAELLPAAPLASQQTSG